MTNVIERIKEGENIFCTGNAGTGKSYTLKSTRDKDTIVGAPTGVAALNVDGVTYHKLFGLPLGIPTQKDYDIIPRKVSQLFSGDAVKKLYMDEIGMLRRDHFDLINHRLQRIRRNTEPFGGIQTVGFGDFFQLPPIVSQSEVQHFYSQYDSMWAFDSPNWHFNTVILDKVWRQSDERQVKMLNSIRTGDKWANLAIQRINEEAKPYSPNKDIMQICCYKQDADNTNQFWYEKEKGKETTFRAIKSGKPDNWTECPVADVVKIKIGCNVMIKANCPAETYVNGDKGVVTDYGRDHVNVRLERTGNDVRVEKFKWTKYEYFRSGGKLDKEEVSSILQIPLILGYAQTAHSCQGLTLEQASVNVGRGCFSHGMLYVTLSRIKNLTNMSFVKPITPSDLIVLPEVKRFYDRIRKEV